MLVSDLYYSLNTIARSVYCQLLHFTDLEESILLLTIFLLAQNDCGELNIKQIAVVLHCCVLIPSARHALAKYACSVPFNDWTSSTNRW